MPNQLHRRQFLGRSAGAAAAGAAAPYFFSSTKTLADETATPNSRFKMGVIGCGGIARANIRASADFADVVALCDVDQSRREDMNKEYAAGKADLYGDYRDLLERDDLDAVMVATPDHWHVKLLIEAIKSGHDVYCEKPMTLTVDEGRLVCEAQKATGKIIQVGTQQRSTFNRFAKAIALVQQGRIGKIKRLEARIGGAPSSPAIAVAEVPKELDWDRWLGPAPAVDYRNARVMEGDRRRTKSNCHYEFRWWYEYSGGKLTDWGAHHVDICSWALEVNGQDAEPLAIDGTAEHPVDFENGVPVQKDRYNTATSFEFNVDLPGGVEMKIKSGGRNGALIEGDKGRIFVSRGKLDGAPVEALKDDPLPEDAISQAYKGLPVEFNERKAHWANFFHCVKERLEPISDVHSHTRAINTCHLAGIAARLGRRVEWDAASGQIPGDEVANSMLARPYREGYEIEG